MYMERIASFCVDHTTLLPGMYLSRGCNAEEVYKMALITAALI